MHMNDFCRKFTSKNETGQLFEALRNLSLVDDIKSMFGVEGSIFRVEWINWPAMGVNAACEA
jgi:hypothetical protein